MKKIILILTIIMLISINSIDATTAKLKKTEHILKKIVTPIDEGPHFKGMLSTREWWYFNVIFDQEESELQNWSAMISFNYMAKKFNQPDILFITLFDDKNKTYGGKISKPRGTLTAKNYGVKLTFENSTINGVYPSWKLHIEDEQADKENEIIMDLKFEAKCLPYWVGMNTGLGKSWSPLGYYSINNCEVTGKIEINNISYKVYGTGYHDHTWILYIIGGASFVWDWFSVHLNERYHAFIWQIIPVNKGRPGPIRPGFGWITDGEKFTDFKIFKIKYLEFENTSIPFLERPKKFHVTSLGKKMELNLIFETKNIHEYLWGNSSFFNIGLWEGYSKVTGFGKWNNDEFSIDGSAISEILRVT
ncbi:MAG: lipocalin-like domain-containing protein [Candidatus Thermoplasmatota archaeon]